MTQRCSPASRMTDVNAADTHVQKALSIYLMCGRETPALAEAAVDGGADLLELGFPFSDPLADGPVIRRAGERALAQGMRTDACLDVLRATRARVDVPLIPMTYASILEAYGWDRFAADARTAGATSLIVADLPAGERPELDRVQLVAPTSTDERLRIAAEQTDGWLYLVTVTGTTGARDGVSPALAGLVDRPRALHRQAPLRRLRHLHARARARRSRARRRHRRRLARRRGRRARPGCPARIRAEPSRRTRQLECVRGRGDGRVFRASKRVQGGACVQVDPPDLGFVATAVRLLRVWKEQWRLVMVGLTLRPLHDRSRSTIAILIRHAIDNSIAPVDGERQRALAVHPDRRPPLGAPLRDELHAPLCDRARRHPHRGADARAALPAYLRFPRAFYDQHATGQVVSRATNDLYPIRYFIGWGMVQGAQS